MLFLLSYIYAIVCFVVRIPRAMERNRATQTCLYYIYIYNCQFYHKWLELLEHLNGVLFFKFWYSEHYGFLLNYAILLFLHGPLFCPFISFIFANTLFRFYSMCSTLLTDCFDDRMVSMQFWSNDRASPQTLIIKIANDHIHSPSCHREYIGLDVVEREMGVVVIIWNTHKHHSTSQLNVPTVVVI